jgi:hypothetical protein
MYLTDNTCDILFRLPARNRSWGRISSMRWQHLNSDQLVDYFSREWLPEQQTAIEIHLANCDACAQQAFAVFKALGLTDTWTARAQEKSLQARPVSAYQAVSGKMRSA